MSKYTKVERDKLIKKFKIQPTKYMRECLFGDSCFGLHDFYNRLKDVQKQHKGIDIKNAIIEIECSGDDYYFGGGGFDGMYLQFWQNKSVVELEQEIDANKANVEQTKIMRKENRKRQREMEKETWERLNKKFGKSTK